MRTHWHDTFLYTYDSVSYVCGAVPCIFHAFLFNVPVHMCDGVLQCFAVCCSVLRCVAKCCSVLQCASNMYIWQSVEMNLVRFVQHSFHA